VLARRGRSTLRAVQPVYKKLAAELSEHGIESRYLARVTARVTPEQQLETLEAEIAQEMASALGRSEDRLNLALAELELCMARYQRAIAERAPTARLRELVDGYNAQRTQVQGRLRELVIHREAVGFRRNQLVHDMYPVPPKLEL
jgi:hypothetical protein